MATAVVAAAYGGPEVLSVIATEVPSPGPGEVTIEVRASGVNPIDYKLYSGAFGSSPDNLPVRLGVEVAGVITAAGPDAAGPSGPLSVGDEVVAYPTNGGYATSVTVPAKVVVPKPAELSWEQASGLLAAGSTAVHAVAAAKVSSGDTVLVHGGSGAVGLLAVQLSLAAGARVVATASERNQALLREVGAVAVTYGPGLLDRVTQAAPSGVNAAIDAVGTDEAIDVSLAVVPESSRIVSINAFHRADTGIALIGGGPGADPGTEIRANAWRQLFPLAATGKLTLLPTKTYPLAEAAQAHIFLREGHPNGKLVLLPAQ
ncbi:MAG TPA: NADP-dependent oxidoreductase [Pseudonocardia sp.]|uniref:quinone oxidoreductase family protein n=1 Tax=Pseudonocardia sp. TaxID=60912 RepID=UPI002CE487DE|nr:NADP-dependent oxidoreductase [Pseudonocardia sp.]HTF54988.1 NADP-dependent oxidoreductase [Pseudonocardia sp.]